MKAIKRLFFILTLVAFAWTLSAAVPECATEDEDDVKIYEDPDNCAAFYECSHGVAYLFECSVGLYFNVELQVCDFSNDVDCGTRPILPTTKSVN
ncbi:hypothetical protein D910_01719 [Dendroctonus ponderosae]